MVLLFSRLILVKQYINDRYLLGFYLYLNKSRDMFWRIRTIKCLFFGVLMSDILVCETFCRHFILIR